MSEPRRPRSREDYERGLPDPMWAAVVLFVLGAIAVVDIVVIVRRKARGEPG